MDHVLFLSENYHYALALYGVARTAYSSYSRGRWAYGACKGVYRWVYPPPEPENWEMLDKIYVEETVVPPRPIWSSDSDSDSEPEEWVMLTPLGTPGGVLSSPKSSQSKSSQKV